jgi:NAD(P)-dependent dehydrogenase (short-subunit alcohol dehydrogenase family)
MSSSQTPALVNSYHQDQSESNFDKIFSVNVKGLLFTVQKALPLFQDGGSIILTSSVAGSRV